MAALEAYQLSKPTAGHPKIPDVPRSVWVSHEVIFCKTGFVGHDYNIAAGSFALVEKGTARRLMEQGLARPETKAEAALAKENGQPRGAAQAVKPKPKPRAKAKAADAGAEAESGGDS